MRSILQQMWDKLCIWSAVYSSDLDNSMGNHMYSGVTRPYYNVANCSARHSADLEIVLKHRSAMYDCFAAQRNSPLRTSAVHGIIGKYDYAAISRRKVKIKSRVDA